MIYLPTTLNFKIRELSDESPLGNLIQTQLHEPLGTSFTIEGGVQFLKSNNTATRIFKAKIDTGAFMSLFPYPAFKELNIEDYVRYTLYGINRIPECAVECAISKCRFVLVDSEGKKSKELSTWVAFALTEDIPSLIGMKGILDSYNFNFDSKQKQFSLIII